LGGDTSGTVKRAGKVLSDSVRHPLTIDEQTVRDAELVLENWRSAHAFALNSVQMTLRRQVDQAQLTADVSRRLKERRTIIEKLRPVRSQALVGSRRWPPSTSVQRTMPSATALSLGWR
jgi:hypothetical protein